MNLTLDYLIWPALLVLLVVAVCVGVLQKRRRRRELRALADRLGFRYTSNTEPGIHQKFGHFPQFVRGERWWSPNLLRGEVEIAGRARRVYMGDYRYREAEGDSRGPTGEFSYLLVQQPCGPSPELCLREERMLDTLASAVTGGDDIDFESAEFSRRFHVSCADKRFAYAVITPRVMEHALAGAPRVLRSGRCWWLSYEGSGLWNAARFERRIRWMVGFLEQWPEYLLQDLGPPPERLTGFLAGESC